MPHTPFIHCYTQRDQSCIATNNDQLLYVYSKLGDWRWQDRYKAILVENDSYLLELSRYVVLNPGQAGWVKLLINGPRVVIQLRLEKNCPAWLQTD